MQNQLKQVGPSDTLFSIDGMPSLFTKILWLN